MNILEMLPDLKKEVLEQNRDWIPRRLLGDDNIALLVFQSFVVKTPDRTILIDSCIGNDKTHRRPLFNMRSSDTYMLALKQAGLAPQDIDFVMCTHMHVDHVGWNTRLDQGRWVPTFPNARYIFGKVEFDHWTAVHQAKAEPVYAESILPVVEAGMAQIVADDFQIEEAVRLVATPGHTPGHFAVAIGSGEDEIVFAGDLLHTPLQLRYPELSFAFDHDKAQAAVTRRSFLDSYSDRPALCCFAHFPMAHNGRIRPWGEGFRCEPAA
jgi:glyoxylase-like metal-dependent hydrolase (beta-lactamase superfamily II)